MPNLSSLSSFSSPRFKNGKAIQRGIAFTPFHSKESFTGHPIQLQIVNVQVEWSLLMPNLSSLSPFSSPRFKKGTVPVKKKSTIITLHTNYKTLQGA